MCQRNLTLYITTEFHVYQWLRHMDQLLAGVLRIKAAGKTMIGSK